MPAHPSTTFLSAAKPITVNLLKSGRLTLTSERLSLAGTVKNFTAETEFDQAYVSFQHPVPYVQNISLKCLSTAIKEFVTGNSDIFVNLPTGYAKSL